MRGRSVVLVGLILFAAACGSADGGSKHDAAGGEADGSGPGPDDASSPIIDVAVIDWDAAGADANGMCNGVGEPCTMTCPNDLVCHDGGGGGVCAPDRPGCGGFAGATCDDPNAPICMYLAGADFGICVDAAERECICNTSPGAVQGC